MKHIRYIIDNTTSREALFVDDKLALEGCMYDDHISREISGFLACLSFFGIEYDLKKYEKIWKPNKPA
jgi:hypothetical protein